MNLILHSRTGESCDECLTFPGCVNGNCTSANECNCHDGWFGSFCDIRKSRLFSSALSSFDQIQKPPKHL